MNKKEKQIIETIQDEPLGDDDIKKYLPHAKILKYSSLKKYNSIEDLLKNDIDYCIILYEAKKNSGHWTALLRYNNIIEYFDSYGNKINTPLIKWNTTEENIKRNQDPETLFNLFDKTDKHIIYNTTKYQNINNDIISTCGRHCIFRILNLIKYNRDLKAYHKIMKEYKKKTKRNYDEIISALIDTL